MTGAARLVLALLAGPALVFLDYLLVGGMFVYQPAGSEAFALVLLISAVAAVVLRRHWLLFAAQNMVTALACLRVMQMTDQIRLEEGVTIVAYLVIGNALAWLVARAFPHRAGWA